MEDASTSMPVQMLASAGELDVLGRTGVDASAAMHLFGVYDGHGGSEVANYCGDRIHVVLREALRRAAAAAVARAPEGSVGELLGIQELWEKAFCECFKTVDDKVSGEASRSSFADDGVGEARFEPVACRALLRDKLLY